MRKYSLPGFLLFFAVMLGAFGAHGLEGKVSEKALATYKTGNLYHFFHSFGIMFLIIISEIKKINLKLECRLMLLGILIFSGCCYLYSLTSIKFFAMLVPIGGVSFLIAWLLFSLKCLKQKHGLS